MGYVITEACIDVKDRACVEVCPVDCIYEGADQLFIDSEQCICCGACEPECPVEAIFDADRVPDQWTAFIERNADFFRSGAAGSDRPVARRK